MSGLKANLPKGIVPIVQTPFDEAGRVDTASFLRLVEDAVESGATGLVYPAVASEVHALRFEERVDLLRSAVRHVGDQVKIVAGVSSADVEESAALAKQAAADGADALLICPTKEVTSSDDALTDYLRTASGRTDLPIILQDLDWAGPGLAIESILQIAEAVLTVRGIKVETTPAGPKYTAVRKATKDRLHVSGGWAVTQMLDGLERGIDALMPEASMVRIYRRIWDQHHGGNSGQAKELFDRIAPVLLFSNQHIDVSIQFFKHVLRTRGIFRTTMCRGIERPLDEIQAARADELAGRVVELIASLAD